LGHIGFERSARFDQPPVSYGDEKYGSDERPQMRLSTLKRGDEPRSSDDDRDGFWIIRLVLSVENGNEEENQQSNE
jgi:hypothetical protein